MKITQQPDGQGGMRDVLRQDSGEYAEKSDAPAAAAPFSPDSSPRREVMQQRSAEQQTRLAEDHAAWETARKYRGVSSQADLLFDDAEQLERNAGNSGVPGQEERMRKEAAYQRAEAVRVAEEAEAKLKKDTLDSSSDALTMLGADPEADAKFAAAAELETQAEQAETNAERVRLQVVANRMRNEAVHDAEQRLQRQTEEAVTATEDRPKSRIGRFVARLFSR